MNRLSQFKQELLVASLVQGNSLRGAAQLVKITKNTAIRNFQWLGAACQRYHDKHVRGLTCEFIEADELWSFTYAKENRLPDHLKGSKNHGVTWTWVGMDPTSKLVMSWRVGKREFTDAQLFANDLASRISGKVQISTDKLMHYRPAFEAAFGTRASYGTVGKKFAQATKTEDGKFEQPELKEMRRHAVIGNPDPSKISTHNIERQNLTVRMSQRRYARDTNAFSKKIENTRFALALHYMHYNFVRFHETLRMPPAMAHGIAKSPWTLADIVSLVDDPDPARRGI